MKDRIGRFLDEAVTLAVGSIFVETNRSNRDGESFIIERHNRGGRWGYVVTDDGIAVGATSRDIIYKTPHGERSAERIVVGKLPEGFHFVTGAAIFELCAEINPRPVIGGPRPHATFTAGFNTSVPLSEEAAARLFTASPKG